MQTKVYKNIGEPLSVATASIVFVVEEVGGAGSMNVIIMMIIITSVDEGDNADNVCHLQFNYYSVEC